MTNTPSATARPIGIGVIGANSFVANAAVMPAIDAADSCFVAATASASTAVPERWRSTEVSTYDAVLSHRSVEGAQLGPLTGHGY